MKERARETKALEMEVVGRANHAAMGNEACSSLNSETLPVILSIMLLSNRDKSERDIHCWTSKLYVKYFSTPPSLTMSL